MIVTAVALALFQNDDKYIFVIIVLAIGLAVRGIKDIVFYFTMARHMVGGKMILFQGVVILDFAVFAGSLTNVPKIYILLYLLWIHAFSGAIEILRAIEAKRTVDGPWRMKFGHGMVNLLLALSSLIYIRHINTAVLIYCLGLIYSALIRIISAFRRTAFMVIE